MSRPELELAYLRAMRDWMAEEHKTHMMVMDQNVSGYSEQVKKEEAALRRYREAELAFIHAPKE
jgi:hypothetical protein